MCFSIFRGLTDRPVQAQTSWNAALKNLHLSQRWITGYICFPSEYLCGRGVWAHNRLGQAGIQKVQRAHIHAWTLQSKACTYVNSCIQMTTSLFKRSDAQAWIHRERVRSVVSLALVWSLSLSLSLCPFFFFMSWCCRMSFLCGRHPPTHLCPSGPSGPESIWHLPLCLSSCHLRRPPPTALMRRQVYSESTHTHKTPMNSVTSASTQGFVYIHKNTQPFNS